MQRDARGDAVKATIPARTAMLASPVSIPALARKAGVPRATMFRRLMRMHAADALLGADRAAWLFRRSDTGRWCVNLSRMYAEHPEEFDTPTPEDLQSQIVEVREYSRETRKQVNALHAGLREHREEHRKAGG